MEEMIRANRKTLESLNYLSLLARSNIFTDNEGHLYQRGSLPVRVATGEILQPLQRGSTVPNGIDFIYFQVTEVQENPVKRTLGFDDRNMLERAGFSKEVVDVLEGSFDPKFLQSLEIK